MKTAALKFFRTNLTLILNVGVPLRDAIERLLSIGDKEPHSIATFLLYGPLGREAVERFKTYAITAGIAGIDILTDIDATRDINGAFVQYVIALCHDIEQKQLATL